MIRLGNNEVLKTLMKTLTFVDADADANANASAAAEGSTIALRNCCSGELIIKKMIMWSATILNHIFYKNRIRNKTWYFM